MHIQTILDQIDYGIMALPEFQRGYVWNREQVRGLMDSLYRKHPVGGLLVWLTQSETARVRGKQQTDAGTIHLLLDGQQRMTSLYGIIKGQPPPFFVGNEQAFIGLHFNLEEELFEFYAPVKMKDNPLWIDVTRLMQRDIGEFIVGLTAIPELHGNLTAYVARLGAITAIKTIDLHIEQIIGQDKTIDVVVDIFNRVNSGGTKLSKGDLALAKICAEWPDARTTMQTCLDRWAQAGFHFDLDWLLRNITTILTGQALFAALRDVDAATVQTGLKRAESATNYLLNLIGGRLGLDHDRVLGGRYAFPVLTRYLVQRGGKLADAREQDRLLYWYVQSFLWGRFTGSTETILNQDLRLIDETDAALDRLIDQLRRSRGDLLVRPENFSGWSLGARFYPLLYLLTRVAGARDWGSGLPISASLLGKTSALQVHHIFPRALLYRHGFDKAEVNALANYCFLTQGTNLDLSDSDPAVYFPQIAEKFPEALESQWVPMDRHLWKVEHYRQFLLERQRLLAHAANQFLEELLHGTAAVAVVAPVDQPPTAIPGMVTDEEEERLLRACNDWVVSQRLPEGHLTFELADPESGDQIAVLDLAWPRGLQEGRSEPVAVLLNETKETEEAANRARFRFFTSVEEFRAYVLREILAEGMDEAAD